MSPPAYQRAEQGSAPCARSTAHFIRQSRATAHAGKAASVQEQHNKNRLESSLFAGLLLFLLGYFLRVLLFVIRFRDFPRRQILELRKLGIFELLHVSGIHLGWTYLFIL